MFGLVKALVKGLEKPEFVVLDSAEKYEVRQYPAAKWVATTVKSISHKEASSQAFRRLFKYIGGENEGQVSVEMTAPVTVRVEPGAGPTCEDTFTEAFYIPTAHQANPPKPTNPEVFIEERPEMTVYVGTFPGFADDEKWVEQGRLLTEAIGQESLFRSDLWYTAGYDPPFKLVSRTNEIWFVKKTEGDK